ADLADGEDRPDADERVARADDDQLGLLDRLDRARRGPGRVLPLEAHAVDVVPVAAGDEPLLERERARGRVDPGAQEVVGRGQERRLDPKRGGQTRRDGGQRLSLPQRLRTHEVEPEIAVAEPEPALAAEPAGLL